MTVSATTKKISRRARMMKPYELALVDAFMEGMEARKEVELRKREAVRRRVMEIAERVLFKENRDD